MTDKTMLRVLHALMSGDAEEKKKLLAELSEGVTWGKYLEFTQKEISSMPQKYRKMFRVGKLRAYMRERRRGGSINYEVRCRMDDINISAGGTTKEEARQRFIEKLNALEHGVKTTPTKFGDFIEFYFENFRKRKVAANTYKADYDRVKKHILPALGEMRLSAITPSVCQAFIDKFSDRGKTAQELFSLLSQTFKCAIAHHLIQFSPLDTLIRPTHESVNGTALTREQEARLLSETPEKYREAFAIALYTGLRPNEYETLRRDGDMLIAKNSKRKNRKIEYKRIPICPMLRPYISESPTMPCPKTLWNAFKKLFPDYTLYDLRTTFNTRCVECHVDDNARKLMMGHSLGRLANAYTDVSDEFLRQEAEKLFYPFPKIDG
ncbi:MAG TPA: site-specific integrase [Firmicutes bacterium]|nr:site-specific integrase [Bacillota bacterium]